MKIIHYLAFFSLLQLMFSCDQPVALAHSSNLADRVQVQKGNNTTTENTVYRSADGGQTWLDIGEGLPESLQGDGIRGVSFFANDNGLFLRDENGIYHSRSNSTAPFWKKEKYDFPRGHGSFAPCMLGMITYSSDGQFLQKTKGQSWHPVFTSFEKNSIRTVFETAGGTVLIGTNHHLNNNQLFRSTNGGKTWKQIQTDYLQMKMVESNGVLLATGAGGILRSTDDGETWHVALSEGAVGIDIEKIKGGVAAITYNSPSGNRRIHTSYDGGNTWQSIDGDLPADPSIVSIVQAGDDFYCGHPNGIYRSSDKGKTWKLLVPSVDGKVFNLYVSGDVIYAIPRFVGC